MKFIEDGPDNAQVQDSLEMEELNIYGWQETHVHHSTACKTATLD